MRVTCELNGSLRLRMEPEGALEQAFLAEMAALSEKGATTVLAGPPDVALATAKGIEFILEVGQ